MRLSTSRLERRLGSFKFRLAAFFVLLSLVPLVGAVWAFDQVANRGETGRADARLNAGLRVALAEFENRVEGARDRADSLARAIAFQQALELGNRASLVRLFDDTENAAVYVRGRLAAGSPAPGLSVRRETTLGPPGRPVGRVVAWVPLDARLAGELEEEASLGPEDELALVTGGRVIGGPAAIADAELPREEARDVEIAGESYRALATELTTGQRSAALVALRPTATIDAATADLQQRMLLLALAALAIAGTVVYFLGRSIVRSLRELADAAGSVARGNFASRVPVRGRDEFAALAHAFNDMAEHVERHLEELASERARARDAISRFGTALAATHNQYLLLPVIVESIVEATGARGGRLVVDGREAARAGDPGHGGEPLTIPLAADDPTAVLVLTPREPEFSDDERALAQWLASQARTALENATLHKRLEQAALMDGLTELPNRRQFEDSLAQELSRVDRFGGVVALVVADLDDFKQVNDRYGHLAGDDVLRAFADVLRANVRDVDTAARYGGEEFAILLPGTHLEGAERVAERIGAELSGRVIPVVPDLRIRVTASFGVAAYPPSTSEEDLFAAADDALYAAKAAGKNRVVRSDETTTRAASIRRRG